MELQARHEELRRKGIQRMRGDTINLAMLGRANLPPAALRPVGGGDRQQLRKRVSKGNAARNSVELDESTGSDHGVHDTSASPEAEHSLSSAAAGIAAEDRPSRLPPFPGSRLLGGTYLTARKRSATNPAPFLY